MITYFGFLVLVGLVVGGIYLYKKVDRLDQEIAKQRRNPISKAEDENY